jgi:hypothetical protein
MNNSSVNINKEESLNSLDLTANQKEPKYTKTGYVRAKRSINKKLLNNNKYNNDEIIDDNLGASEAEEGVEDQAGKMPKRRKIKDESKSKLSVYIDESLVNNDNNSDSNQQKEQNESAKSSEKNQQTEEETWYTCKECFMRFISKQLLDEHVVKHTGSYLFLNNSNCDSD